MGLSAHEYLGFDQYGALTVYWGSQVRQISGDGANVMSLRLGTGIVGHIDCSSGNRKGTPKGPSEVMVGVGEVGIARLVELGGLPCVACKSGVELSTMSQGMAELLRSRLGGELGNATDFNYLVSHYDSTKLGWLQILEYFAEFEIEPPKRLYVPRNMKKPELDSTRSMFQQFGKISPQIGYYDREKRSKGTDSFTELD